MDRLLRRLAPVVLLTLASGLLSAAELGERHELRFAADLSYPSTDSSLGAWPEAGFGKLRFESPDEGLRSTRLVAEYRGQIGRTVWAKAIVDYVDDGFTDLGLTEAYIDLRPLPTTMNHHRFRFGAYYPPFSLENSGTAWSSPFTTSFSAINAWLGEEIRPIGAEWKMQRHIAYEGSPHEISLFAGVFYGNDPAGTLLFWRGFSLHDRQTRLNERLPLPPMKIFDANGAEVANIERRLDPIAELDHDPGAYAGFEWRYARRALIQLGYYDNRADPYAFRDHQWGWDTSFLHLAAQWSLPGDFGLITQWMRGDTKWLIGAMPDGTTSSFTELVRDDFDSQFVLLTKRFSDRHRMSLRHDRFDFARQDTLNIDHGHAWTLAYEFQVGPRTSLKMEWLEIESSRDLWPQFYGVPAENSETQLQLAIQLTLFES